MGTRLAVNGKKTLYEYWGDAITERLLTDLNSQNNNGIEEESIENKRVEEMILVDQTQQQKKSKKGKCKEDDQTLSTTSIETNSRNKNRGSVKVVVNCASQEYFKSVNVKKLSESGVKVVECVFKDKGRIVSVYAKRARGLMARFIVTEGMMIKPLSTTAATIIDADTTTTDNTEEFQRCLTHLKSFNLEGYAHEPSQSTDTCIVFNRAGPPPPPSTSSSSATTTSSSIETTSTSYVEEGVVKGKGKGKGKGKTADDTVDCDAVSKSKVGVKVSTVKKEPVRAVKKENKTEIKQEMKKEMKEEGTKKGKEGSKNKDVPLPIDIPAKRTRLTRSTASA